MSRLRDAWRLAFFLRVPEERLRPSSLEILAAILLSVCMPTIYSIATIAADGRFASWEFPQVLFHVTLLLAAASAAARLVRRSDAVATLLFAALLVWFAVDVVTMVVWIALQAAHVVDSPALTFAWFYAPVGWVALACARFAYSIQPGRIARLAGIAAVYAILVALPFGSIPHERSLWVKDWSKASKDDEQVARVTDEEVFYRQPELLARELARVEPGRKGVIDVFFVGVAGYGPQGVFTREVDSVAKLMSERFGAAGHIVKLENDRNSLTTNPIASTTSLRAALKRVAESMDPDEDVLVLFLTSHGSQDFRFSLELWPLRFKPLDPATLRGILDESGIRNRVVVISACYSGGFVDKLRDDDTLVITAAARDRNSFGCDSMAEWTYFGRAYFDEALRQTYSFTKAFDIARPLIEQREKAQKFDPSNPQIAVGARIQQKIDALAEQQQRSAH